MADMPGTPFQPPHLVFDCVDLARMSGFWSALLGLEVTKFEDGWVRLSPLEPGGLVLDFQRVPEPKQVKNRLHLDLPVADLDVGEERVLALGASGTGEEFPTDHGFRVFRDPEGNEFCLILP